MAEVLGIVGGIASLMGLLEQIGRIYDQCRHFKNGSVEIQNIAIETRMLRMTFDTSTSQLKILEDQGCEIETLRDESKVISAVHFFVQKKESRRTNACIGKNEKTTMMAAKAHFESILHQKQYMDIKTLVDSMSIAQQDSKGVLLRILDNTNRTNEIFTRLETLCTGILHQKMGGTAQLKKQCTKKAQSHGRERCSRASPKPATILRPQNDCSVFEEFSGKPFHLLVVCIFLNRTKKPNAVRQARILLQQYPTPEALAMADCDDIKLFFKHLGLLKRGERLVELAKTWCMDPPQANKLHRKGTGRSEVSHLKSVGNFASDTWRIFCKDDLYKDAGDRLITPEWKRVLPSNEVLKTYLRNLWDKEGYDWDPKNGAVRKRGSEIPS